MRHWKSVLVLALVCAIPAVGAKKQKGTAQLKDVQPAGMTDKKNKNQRFDLMFVAGGMEYICRTPDKSKLKATDFPVGSDIRYELDKDKAKLKNASGEEVKCTVVRVEKLADATPAPAAQN